MNLKIRFLLNANGTNIFGGLVNVIYSLYTFGSIYLDNLNLLFSLFVSRDPLLEVEATYGLANPFSPTVP